MRNEEQMLNDADDSLGLLGAVFDRTYDHLLTPKLVRAFYSVAMTALTMFHGFLFLWGWSFTESRLLSWLGWGIVICTPLSWFLTLMAVRVSTEFTIVQFKISEDLARIRKAIT